MKTLPNLSEYLKSQGVDDATPAERIQTVKNEYWKLYQQQYYQHRKKQHQRLTLRLTQEEYRRLQTHAKEYENLSFSAFIKQAALAYLEEGYIPRDSQKTDEVTKSIRKIGNLINQVVQSLHRTAKRGSLSGAFSDENDIKKLYREYEFLVKRVADLEKEAHTFFASPPTKIGKALIDILQDDPAKIQEVRALLDELEMNLKK